MAQQINKSGAFKSPAQPILGGSSLSPWRRWDVILATISLNIFSLVMPILVFQLYDRIIPNQSYDTLIILALGAVIVVVLEAIIRFSRSHIVTWLGLRYEHATTLSAYNHLLHSRIDDIAQSGAGEHVENIESSSSLKEFMAGSGFLALIDLPFAFLFIGIIGWFSMKIALGAFVIMVTFMVAALILGLKLKQLLEDQLDINDRRYNFIIELFANHHTLKSMGMEDLLLRRYERIQKTGSAFQYKVNHAAEKARDLGETFSYTMFIGVAGVAAWEVIHGASTIGIMGATIVLTNRILQPVQAAMGMWTRFQYFIIARKRMKELFDLTLENPETSLKQQITRGKVTLKDIAFHYGKNNRPLLNNLNLIVESGQMVTIRGKNGVGKTTLMLLIMGNLTPIEGEILIDDTPLRQINPHELRRKIVYLPPKGIMFQGTIMENMTMFRGGGITAEAVKISQKLGLDEWVHRLPLGYETKVGDTLFMLLPDGIHQRICLVRALVNRPKILILDEANTSLDDHGDQLLREVLKSLYGEMTILFVTHRPSMQQMADESYELENGILVKQIFEKSSFSSPKFFLENEAKGSHNA